MKKPEPQNLRPAAGNGLLDRRAFVHGGAALAAAMSGCTLSRPADAEPLEDAEWMRTIGPDVPDYGRPSPMEGHVVGSLVRRTWGGVGNRRTPDHLLNGTVTPSGLHFFLGHSGLPNIDPAAHQLLIHGLVQQPLVSSSDTPRWCPPTPSASSGSGCDRMSTRMTLVTRIVCGHSRQTNSTDST